MMNNDAWMERQRKRQIKFRALVAAAIIIAAVGLLFAFVNPIRFDYAAGNHRIIPTAVDTDLWGNYKVYFKTSDFTQNRHEDFYYIGKGQDRLVDQVNKAIIDSKELVVYYDQYIGWKGFTAPRTSPIIRIEAVRNNVPNK